METITPTIGTVISSHGYLESDDRRSIQFEAELLATLTTYGTDRDGIYTENRGTFQTLYRVADQRLIVHVRDWSKWSGEPTTEILPQVSQADLHPGGPFSALVLTRV